MGTTPSRYAWIGLSVVVGAALVLASPAVLRRQQVAHAEQIRKRCVRELTSKRAWSARITETERGSEGATVTVHQDLLIRGPGEYRVTMRERDDSGGEVVSTTLRTGTMLYVHRANPDGSTELRVIRGVRPSLGVQSDNLLGETVAALSSSDSLRVVGRGIRNGRAADKLELEPGHFVWVDQEGGLPVEEQVVAGGRTAHAVSITDFNDEADPSPSEFDVASLGVADATITEDLGFRSVADPRLAAKALGFTPLGVASPPGFTLELQGYVDPTLMSEGGPAEAAFMSELARGSEGIVVTQTRWDGAELLPTTEPDDGSFERITVAGTPATVYHDAAHDRLVFVRRGVLVTVEGTTAKSLLEIAEAVR